MHCTWVYNNEFFYYKVVTCNARDKFLLAKSAKKILRMVNFTNLKTPGGYIAKSKSQGVCLQLRQTPWVIMQFSHIIIFCIILCHLNTNTNNQRKYNKDST
jgi:hypothetical protein